MSEQVAASAGALPGAVGGAKVHSEPATAERTPADGPRRRRLPATQPLRAIVVCLAYLLLVAASFVVLSQLYRTPIAVFFSTGFAALLTVPLTVLAPSPYGRTAQPHDARPVLQRASRLTKP